MPGCQSICKLWSIPFSWYLPHSVYIEEADNETDYHFQHSMQNCPSKGQKVLYRLTWIPSACRYDRPGSFYQYSVPHLIEARKSGGSSQGSTTQEAGFDITNAILKSKPKRYVYTGKMLWFSLKWGFYQLWGYRYREAQLWMQQSFLLNDCAAKGPRKWDGPYVPPPPENQTLKVNGDKSEKDVPETEKAE